MSKIPAQIVGVLLFAAAAAFGQTAMVTGGPLAFGTTFVGTTTVSATPVVVTADPMTTLDQITSSQLTVPAGFLVSIGTCTTGMGNSCTLTVSFMPTAVTSYSGNLVITATTTTGTVVTPVAVTPSSVALTGTGYQPAVAVQLMGKVVTVTNTLSSPLQFTYMLSGSSDLMITGGTCASLATPGLLASGSCTITIGPGGAGTSETDSLTVTAMSGTTPVAVIGAPAAIGEPATVGTTTTSGTASANDTGLEQFLQLTAGPTSATMPDGTMVPMWGYTCGAPVAASGATCAKLNPTSTGWSPVVITVPTGQALEIELRNNLAFVPAGATTTNGIPTSLVIVGQVGGGLGSSRTIAASPSHALAQGCPTWFIASGATPPGVPCPALQTGSNIPPTQVNGRVQSMATEVTAGTSADLTWQYLKPGTYLLESGTHPSIQVPMGLIGVLVVTTAPSGTTAGTAYPLVGTAPAVQYNAELPLEFSEIDPVQNKAVDTAVRTAGFNETAVWTKMNAPVPITALTLGNPGSGYTSTPNVTISGGGGSGATATAIVGALVSGITATGGTACVAPAISFTDSTGSGAAATATVAGGSITGITVTNPGSLYTSPTVTVTDTGNPSCSSPTVTATATLAGSYGVIYALNLTNAGSGFVSAPLVSIDAPTTGTTATATAVVTLGGCGTANTCYPPAVNYTPFYYLINGVAFSKSLPAASLFAATAGADTTGLPVTTGIKGTLLVRLVNAGLRLHVPSIVGSLTQGFNGAGAAATVGGFTLIAEDGNPLPGVQVAGVTTVPATPRVQTDVLMVPSKVYDALVNVPQTPSGATAPPSLPVYDRELSLSANSSVRDAGMIAYISVNGAGLPAATGGMTGVFAAAQANADAYPSLVAGQPFTVSDPSKGVIANDINVYGVTLLTAPAHGTITCGALAQSTPTQGMCANGTFTYTPNAGSTATSDSFTYCANGTVTGTTCSSSLTATVTLSGSLLTGNPSAISQAYTAKTSTYIKIPSPGLLAGNSDPNGLPLSVVLPTTPIAGVVQDAQGGFTVLNPTPSTTAPTTFSFNYTVQNSQGRNATGSATVTFPVPGNLQVTVLDAQQYKNCNLDSTCISGLTPLTDYRWIIEEDKTFWVDPSCTTNSSITTPGCPAVVGPAGQSTVPVLGVNFHTSTMDFVAQGCTGPLSCEGGQTMLDTRPACISPGVPTGCSTTAGQHIAAVCDLGNGACRPDTTGFGYTQVNPKQVALDPAKRYYISVLPGDAANPFPSYAKPPACGPTPYSTQPAPGVPPTAANLNTSCGHTMSGAPIPPACNILGGPNACTTTSAFTQPVTVLVLPAPLPTGKLSVIVFEDDFPLNGEQDGGGGNGTVAPIEPGLGGFNLVLWDTFGGLGDVTGQDTYDMFNMPLSNSLAGTIDPVSGIDACPLTAHPLTQANGTNPSGSTANPVSGMTGMIVTCPKYEADNATLSPLAGQAVIANLMPEKFSVQAYPGADRIARGEEWLQTNTLDGQHPHDSFIRIGEPSYFQEYGPAGYHVSIGFANPAIINARHADVCNGFGTPGTVGSCNNTISGQVDVQRISRTPDQRLYPSGSRDGLAWTQCWVSLGDPDGEDFMFSKCDASGNFQFTGVPGGEWRLTIGDQWNDQIIDGLSTPVNVGTSGTGTVELVCPGPGSSPNNCNMGNIGVQQWQANLYTRVFIDDNKNGIWDPGEIGIPFLYTRIYYRDGHNANGLNTDFNGVANFNETYPLFNWYVVEADSTRYKTTGTHTVYDAGGPADGSTYCGNGATARQCGTSTGYNFLSNTYEAVPLPADLSVPGAVYCAKADCAAEAGSALPGATPTPGTFQAGTAIPSPGNGATASTGRIDPPWVWGEGWAGLTGLSNWIDFGKAPYASCPPACATVTATAPGATTPTTTQVGENGGIQGQVTYASTRPFDDASQMILQPWEPLVPHVTINLYQEGFAADGVTPTLTMVDTTQTTSWDSWAQGFYPGAAAGGTGTTAGSLPYMNCPGQGTNASTSPNQDVFYFTLFDQPNYLDWYNSEHNGGTLHTLPYNSQYKCYDSMHIGNQIQPAFYDGRYFFPSSLGIQATGTSAGKPVTAKGSTNGVAASLSGTNCTICVPNPDTTDVYRVGTPMLPPGKYVVQVIMPPGYEVYKEEDKNLLIGDNYISPVTQQFAGLGGSIFIIPDQASVASLYDPAVAGYNANNFQNQTLNLGLNEELSGVPGYPGFQDPVWPCVGEMRVVPDYLSLFPLAAEVAPFAGATRPLCDRKEVTLANQMSVRMHFAIFTSTHIASKYTGGITDDLTSEFDPFSPQFGEKFAPPNMPVSTRDYLGNEISRVYSDHWGTYNGLTYSSWEVNPPNITGYSPTMMVQCMNDPGPVVDTRPGSATFGTLITDPLYNSAYSDFCYEQPFMPGLTNYADTPVVPTQAFVGAGYNNVDCALPDATPEIAEVDTQDGIGPWMSAFGHTLTITALGNQHVQNYSYSGPSASVAPFNQKIINRNYGFGATPSGCPASGSCPNVTVGGVPLTGVMWTDTTITGTIPATANTAMPFCPIQQQTQYAPGASPTYCGQLMITAANGNKSVDTVTITIGGKTPTHVAATCSTAPGALGCSIQGAIDAAAPGDLIIVDPTCASAGAITTCATPSASNIHTPASHTEMLLMWKPVRLQGVGAPSSVINANAQPAGRLLDPWRRHINCLFGLTLQGTPYTAPGGTAPYDPNSTYSCPDAGWTHWGATGEILNPDGTVAPNGGSNPQVDRLEGEATVGWDATLNGNLAEQLQEPSLMGAFEGAGITVLAKGIEFHGASPWNDGTEAGLFPAGATLLAGVGHDPTMLPVGDANNFCHTGTYDPLTGAFTVTGDTNPYPSNYMCNPSSIDGLTIANSSQGGGGIFVHAWADHLQIANNRIYNNAGTLSGGISVGQGEFAGPYIFGGATNAPPGSCSDGTGLVANQHLPDCFVLQPNVHNNEITNNSSLGDELFSATLSGGGGVTFCTGSDYYKFQYNFVCGNLSLAEGGGLVHLGEIQNGDIEHNSIVFNQSSNSTITTNGGGIQIMGTPDTDPTCTKIPDQDCPPGLSDGTGRGLVINANLIQGNMAESGSGGGIRLQQVNGTDVSTFATRPAAWNSVNITNNIIVNNVAGWDGAGISLQDALFVNIVHNTIAHNDSLASSGVLTQSIGTPEASSPAGNCTQPGPAGTTLSASCPQSAGVTTTLNSSLLTATYSGNPTTTPPTPPLAITCPPGHFTALAPCTAISYPALYNDLIYENRSFHVGITAGPTTGTLNQQNTIALFNAVSDSASPSQTSTGFCATGTGASGGPTYWDIGVRGDAGPGNHGSGFTLGTVATATSGTFSNANTVFISQYCNGSRVPPECTVADGCGGPSGYGVPPGIADALTPNPHFTLTPAATVDEGNNWINVAWGPLSLTNDAIQGGLSGNYGGGPVLGNYGLAPNSPAVDAITSETIPANSGIVIPTTDFYGNPRPNPDADGRLDYGAVETQADRCSTTIPPSCPTLTLTSISPNTGVRGATVNVTLSGTNLTGASNVTVSGTGITVSAIGDQSSTTVLATFTIAATAASGARSVSVVTPAGTAGPVTFTIPPAVLTSITPNFGARGQAVPVTFAGSNLTGATAVNAGTGVTCTAPVVATDGLSATSTCTITGTAGTGNRNITLTVAGATTNSVTFTVNGPSITGITPTSGVRGTAVPVTITGTDFATVTAITVSGTGVTTATGSITTVSSTSVTATFNISATAAATARTFTVTGANGIAPANPAVTFTPQGPTLTAITPTTGARGTTVPVTLTGTNFPTTGTTTVAMSGSGITCTGVTVPSSTTVNANCTILATALLTARTITLTTPIGVATVVGTVTFTVVNPPVATLTSIVPNSSTVAQRGTTVPVTLTGTNFTTGSTVAAGAGITVSGVTVVSPTQITANFLISVGTTNTGAHNVTVTNASTTASNAVTFTKN